MESEARELLAQVERAEAAPYIDYEPTPWWCAPYFGLYFVALGLGYSLLESNLLRLAVVAVLVVSLMVVLRHLHRRNGALPMPGRGNPPPEIARAYRRYFWSLLPVGVAVVLCWLLLTPVVAAVVSFAVITAGFVVYDRFYERAAGAVRERLA